MLGAFAVVSSNARYKPGVKAACRSCRTGLAAHAVTARFLQIQTEVQLHALTVGSHAEHSFDVVHLVAVSKAVAHIAGPRTAFS